MAKKDKLAIVNGTLIDGTGREPLKDATVVIEGPKIVDVGRKSATEIPEGCKTIDASGLTIMPGLIDCHVHLSGDRSIDPLHWVVDPPLLKMVRATADAWKILDAGFTTICDISMYGLYLKKAIEEGTVIGPRIIACGRGLSRTGGHGDTRRDIFLLTDELAKELHPWAILCDGVDEVRKVARMQIRKGADVIKFWATGGDLWEKEKVEHRHYTLDEMKAIVDEAHACDIPVFAHCENLQTARLVIEANCDVIIHGDVLDEEVCKKMIEKGMVLISTFSIWDPWIKVFLKDFRAESEIKEAIELLHRSFELAHKTGVKIALGSDSFTEGMTPYGRYNIGEIKLMVEAGLSPMEAIVSATKIGSEALRIDDKVGTLEKGKLADILLVKGNPLDDITVLLDKKNIQTIIKEGKIMRRFGEGFYKTLHITPRPKVYNL